MQKVYDAIIIGSGPAALSAGLRCVKQGLSVIIIAGVNVNPDPSLSYLTPSESLHPGVEKLLELLSVSEVLNFSCRSRYENIWVNGITNDIGKDSGDSWRGYHIDKHLFISYLKNKVEENGVKLVYSKAVKLITKANRFDSIETSDGLIFSGKFCIDGSGQNNFAGRQLKFQRKYFSGPLTTWTGVTHEIDNKLFAELKTSFLSEDNGWTWVAPELNNRCTWTRLARKGQKVFSPPEMLRGYYFTGLKVANVQWRIFRQVVSSGVILCGESAAVIDPASNQGIFMALLSGIVSTDCVCECLNNPSLEPIFLAVYNQWFHNEFEKRVTQLQTYYNKEIKSFYILH